MATHAWAKQSKSLVEVQRQGKGLEAAVRTIATSKLSWWSGKVPYDKVRNYRLQTDFVFPSLVNPKAAISVTYTNPDIKGHSNENKLHLKLGELALLKNAYPQIRAALAIGGTKEAWLPYVLQAFEMMYDEVIFLWKEEGEQRLKEVVAEPKSIQLKHADFWKALSEEWSQTVLLPDTTKPPKGLVRYEIIDLLKKEPRVGHPSLIRNEIARLCMQRSKNQGGTEWDHYLNERWQSIEMSRSYFNPVEALVEICLTEAGIDFDGGVARDIEIKPTLLHDLGMSETSLSEDFVLYSERYKKPVYVQCKASGGGRTQHGKNIQNRTKEQITRGILYETRSPDRKRIVWNSRQYIWVAVVDGDWGVTGEAPMKYVHMLQLAGYQRIFCAANLLDKNREVLRKGNELISYLVDELKCRPMRALKPSS